MIIDRILRSAIQARTYLDSVSRREVIRFVHSRWNADGGVQGRDDRSDLYYTLFAVLCMRALRGRVPLLRLWNYVRSIGDGGSLDAVHLSCLIRLRSIFPVTPRLRRRFATALDAAPAESAYDQFFKILSAETLPGHVRPEGTVLPSSSQTTPNLAASIVIQDQPDRQAGDMVMERFCSTGGFRAAENIPHADLLSTATALFALRAVDADLEPIRHSCLEFVESLWRDSGGFGGYQSDDFEDVEYTFYALLSIGCLME